MTDHWYLMIHSGDIHDDLLTSTISDDTFWPCRSHIYSRSMILLLFICPVFDWRIIWYSICYICIWSFIFITLLRRPHLLHLSFCCYSWHLFVVHYSWWCWHSHSCVVLLIRWSLTVEIIHIIVLIQKILPENNDGGEENDDQYYWRKYRGYWYYYQ